MFWGDFLFLFLPDPKKTHPTSEVYSGFIEPEAYTILRPFF